MISEEDCLAFCGLSEREVAAIAKHERIPDVAAAALANFLLTKDGGEMVIRQMLMEDINDALDHNRIQDATELLVTLRRFLINHPRATEDLPLE